MNDLLRERLIRLLSESTQVANEEIQSAYESFMKRVEIISQSEKNYAKVYRTLIITRIELVHNQCEQEKKCLEICVSAQSNGTYQF